MTAGQPNTVVTPDTIPFKYRNNRIIVQGKINGKVYDFVLDTGAPTLLWEEVAQELKMPKKGATMSAKDAIGTEQQLNFYTATSVQLGNLVVENMNVSTLSTLSDEVKCYANGGIIGGNFMRHYHWQIDYENKRLIVSSDFSRLSIPQDAIRADAIVSLPQGAVVLEDILVGGKEEEFTLDTGNSGYINLGMERWDLKKTGENSSYAEAHCYSNLGTGADRSLPAAPSEQVLLRQWTPCKMRSYR